MKNSMYDNLIHQISTKSPDYNCLYTPTKGSFLSSNVQIAIWFPKGDHYTFQHGPYIYNIIYFSLYFLNILFFIILIKMKYAYTIRLI